MVRATLVLLLFASLTGSALAQTAAPVRADSARTGASAPPTTTAADTVQALHRLFAQRRTGGVILTAVAGGFVLLDYRLLLFAAGPLGLLIGLTPVCIGIGKLTKFSRSYEAELIADYAQHKPLPPGIQRKLKPNFFRH